jgi:hypothetical protein
MRISELPYTEDYEVFQRVDAGDYVTLVLKRSSKDFLLDITGEMESSPETGDLAIFWDKGKEWKAYVAILTDKEFAAQYKDYPYKSSTQEWHGNAIRFRNTEQLSMIINYRPDVAKKEETDKK